MSTESTPDLQPIATREEVLALLSAAARWGSVSAMRALLAELKRDEDGDTIIDELARRRARR